MSTINIALDVFSYAEDIWSVSDYSGEQIYNKLSLPLFRYERDKIALFAATSYKQGQSEITIKIKSNLYWSNGEKVIAADYARAINHIISSDSNRYQNLMLSVIRHPCGVEISDAHTLCINTAWYDPFIINYLSIINFSPMHKVDRNIHAGPYEIREKTECIYKLKTNLFFQCDDERNWFKEVNYILVPQDPNAQTYHQGKVHVSCDTALNLNLYRRSLRKADFHKGDGTLVMLLSPGNKFRELPARVLQLVGRIVDRSKISTSYDHSLIPLKSWLVLYQQEYYECYFSPAKKLSSSIIIDVAFEDFYPNKDILECIREQLLPYNIILNFHEDEYGKWISDCHFRFEIRKIPKKDPIQLIRSDISHLSKDAKYFYEIKKIYSQLYDINKVSQQHKNFKIIDFYLRQNLLYFPLFIFPTGYFCHPQIEKESLMLPGSRIITKRTDK